MKRSSSDPGAVPVRVVTASGTAAVPEVRVPDSGIDLEALERALIQFALDVCGLNRTRAAQFLHLTRSALLYRIHKHSLVGPEGRVIASSQSSLSMPEHDGVKNRSGSQ